MMKGKISNSDKMIQEEILNKNEGAFELLYNRYGSQFYGLISAVIANQDSRNKVLLEGFVRICQDITEFDPENERFFTWMMKIVRQCIAAECQKATRQCLTETGDVVCNELFCVIDRHDYPVFNKVFFFGTPTEEVAKELSLPPIQVRNSLYKAIKCLRNRFPHSSDQ